jgi:pterin-4a-carbinolamine dehydratase
VRTAYTWLRWAQFVEYDYRRAEFSRGIGFERRVASIGNSCWYVPDMVGLCPG